MEVIRARPIFDDDNGDRTFRTVAWPCTACMVNAVALFHRGNRMKYRTTSTMIMLLALTACGQAKVPKSRITTFSVIPAVAFESTLLSDRQLDAWMSEDDDCHAFLMYHDQCAVLVLPHEYDDGFTRRQLRLKAKNLPGDALGAYCRNLHTLWKQQWKGQCPVGEEDDEDA
ncbi:hypothetical protein [Stenotrophomonas sp. CC120222-04]|uniref:hypothetical protein n=1 Tax=Stenotrophomonas sp. CC120222-04 TaxID=1378088 RepID=UPI0020CFD414|nr:hypothetical protein [Stenotrophomonas sp. CC120222-04]